MKMIYDVCISAAGCRRTAAAPGQVRRDGCGDGLDGRLCRKARLDFSDLACEAGVYRREPGVYLVEHLLAHAADSVYRLFAVLVHGSGESLDEHFAHPCHLRARGVDAEKVRNAVPNGGNPPGHFIPKPPGERLDAVPQAPDEVCADFRDLRHALAERVHDAGNNLRHSADDFGDNLREVGNEGSQELYARLDDFRDIVHEGVNYRRDNLRERLYYRQNDLREVFHKGGQKLDSRLDDLRDSVEERRHETFDKLRQSLEEHGAPV